MAQLSRAAIARLGTMEMYPKTFTSKALTMDYPSIWWLIAGVLVAAELLSGTFYLLMLSLGAAAAAIAAHAGGTVTWQIVTAAAVGGAAVVVWHLKQKPRNDAQDTNLHLDIGETVTVQMWDAQGQTQVQHRGAQWSAICQQGQAPQPGLHRITEIVGSRLVLEKI